ncbi:hypothetical protein NM208_g6671 [Fusarium decemcellulare]|uniref:Uncharacterized protein n=1 Tax=Fusarium decemcellulare TaxID=57161 RepID=A0ACC1SC78_9HYPO|nr:hypothetical protein NM208_g6671 [Fusarium decemcellulare]
MAFFQQVTSAADSANTIAEFVSQEQIRTLGDLHDALFPPKTTTNDQDVTEMPSVGVVVLCASAVLSTAEVIISMVKELVKSAASTEYRQPIVLVLCGGVGHSTQLMHEAVRRHPQYSQISHQVQGLPEGRILQAIGERFFDLHVCGKDQGPLDLHQDLTVLVEDTSTNCALNAIKTRDLLVCHGINSPRSIVVAQDPTMCRRTVAAFEQVYISEARTAPPITSWPTFVPKITPKKDTTTGEYHDLVSCLDFVIPRAEVSQKDGLWSMDRFMSLLMGEIPRMRDDENGYGPRGKGSIVHVDIPPGVEEAWETLGQLLGDAGRNRIN